MEPNKKVLQQTNVVPEIKYDLEPLKHLRQGYEQRWRSLAARSEKLGIKLSDKEALWKKVLDCWNRGFKCEYCGDRMKIKEKLPSTKTFTIEHSLALHNGGDNSLNKIFLICKECNNKKGTIRYDLFQDALLGKKPIIPGLSLQLCDFFKIQEGGWTSDYLCISILLQHLGRKSRSSSTRRNYLTHIRSFCLWSMMQPDELVQLSKMRAEELVQKYADTYNNENFSRKTANNVVSVLRSFFEINGYKGNKKLDVEGYFTPRRYRKTNEYVPRKHEIYMMADAAGSLRNRGIVLTMFSSGIRNSTLCALRYKDIKSEILQGQSILKIPIYASMKDVVQDACKGSLPYYTFICEEATEAVQLYLRDRTEKYGKIKDNDPLFASEYNQIDRNLRSSKFLSSRHVQKIIKNSAKSAGIDAWIDVKPHCIRKSFESIIRSETHDGTRLDTKVQEFLMGHILPGCQDNYFDSTVVEELRLEYSKLKFCRVIIENKYKRLRRAVAEAFEGTGVNVDIIIDEYVKRKNQFKKSLKSI